VSAKRRRRREYRRPSDDERKQLARDRELRSLERMMSAGNTYERRGGRVKQRRYDDG